MRAKQCHPVTQNILGHYATQHFLIQEYERGVNRSWINKMLIRAKDSNRKEALIASQDFWAHLENCRKGLKCKLKGECRLLVIRDGKVLVTVMWCAELYSWMLENVHKEMQVQWIGAKSSETKVLQLDHKNINQLLTQCILNTTKSSSAVKLEQAIVHWANT